MIDYADKSYLSFDRPGYRETALEIAQERARIIREKLQYVKAEDTDIYPTFRKVANIRRVCNGLVVDALQ